jgi:hypothetical protein
MEFDDCRPAAGGLMAQGEAEAGAEDAKHLFVQCDDWEGPSHLIDVPRQARVVDTERMGLQMREQVFHVLACSHSMS